MQYNTSKPEPQLRSYNPATGELHWEGACTEESALDGLIAAARAAQAGWARRPLAERAALMTAYADELAAGKAALARLIAQEVGKPYWEAQTEVAAMIGKVAISLRAQRARCGDIDGGKAVTRFRPHGVLAVYGPYNFPGHLPNGHIVPALVAGNAVVFKPSEHAPSVGEWLVAALRRAGLPDGLVQLVQGGPDIGKALSEHGGLDGLLFTGSERVGAQLAQAYAAMPGKILALEMGGNNPLVVELAALRDVDEAVALVVQSAFTSCGQRCTCARRLILVGAEPDSAAFLERLVARCRSLPIGEPFATEPEVFCGPMVSPAAADAVYEHYLAACAGGARSLLAPKRGDASTGYLTPGIIDVDGWAACPDSECFGPLLQVHRVADMASAIAKANATRFGLAAGLLSENRLHWEAFQETVRAGILNWNKALTGASSAAAFGGLKASGNLRPSAYLAADYVNYAVAIAEREG